MTAVADLTADPPAAAGPVSRRDAAILAVLTALALALRIPGLGRSLFTDEAYSIALAQRSFGHMVELFGYEANGIAYSLVLWPLEHVFGKGEVLLRSPALLAGTAAVPALWWAARPLVPGLVALLAAALLAISPMAVFYSQDARAYAFVMLAGSLSFGALARAVRREGRGAWIGYVAAMVLLAYSEVLAAPLLVPAQALLVARGRGRAFKPWLRSLAAVLLLSLPLLVAAAIARGRRNPLYWLPKPGRTLLSVTLQQFTAGISGATGVRWATVAAVAILLGGAVLLTARRAAVRQTLALAAAWALGPVVLLLAVSLVQPLFWPRYAIVALPGLCLLVALAAERLRASRFGLAAAAACVLAIVAASFVADVKQRNAFEEDWRPAAALLRAESSAGQPLILDTVLPLPSIGYYDPSYRAADGELVVPEWRDQPLPAGVIAFKDPGGYGGVADGPPSLQLFQRLASGGSRTVWMVVSEVDSDFQADPRHGPAVAWARSHCRIREASSAGVWVLHASSCR